jgi:hypothetical protein
MNTNILLNHLYINIRPPKGVLLKTFGNRVIPSAHSPRAAHNLQQLGPGTRLLNSKGLRVELLRRLSKVEASAVTRRVSRLDSALALLVELLLIKGSPWAVGARNDSFDGVFQQVLEAACRLLNLA